MGWQVIKPQAKKGKITFIAINKFSNIMLSSKAQQLTGLKAGCHVMIAYNDSTKAAYIVRVDKAIPGQTCKISKNNQFSSVPIAERLRQIYSLKAEQTHRLGIDPAATKYAGQSAWMITKDIKPC